MFDERVQQEVWGSNPDALLCGSYAPVRMAERVDGGFRLTGDWAFASGCENAQWALCAAIIPPNGEGERPVLKRSFWFPPAIMPLPRPGTLSASRAPAQKA